MNSIKNIMPHNYHYGATIHPVSIEPVSRTYQYRKIMKPMLERKRRARINKCLDELKDLLSSTLNADSEHVSKLEKADILEMTVRHLQQLRQNKALYLNTTNSMNTQKFWDGFQRCTAEVQQFLQKNNQNVSSEFVRYFSTFCTSKENCQKYYPLFSVMQAHEFALARKQHWHIKSNIKCIENSSTPKTPAITIEEYNVWRPW